MNPVYRRKDRQLIEGIKPAIYERWLLWQRDKSLYTGNSHFAFVMLAQPFNQGQKEPIIKEPKTVVGWCEKWEKEARS